MPRRVSVTETRGVMGPVDRGVMEPDPNRLDIISVHHETDPARHISSFEPST